MTALAATPPAPRPPSAAGPPPGAKPGFAVSLAAVYTTQLGRARTARVPLFFAATFQSVGILLLLRGVVDTGSDITQQSVVAGSTMLVVAFVALNLLAQRFGHLRAEGGLDYYGTLPISAAAVVTGTAAAWSLFAVPGAVLTAVLGSLVYGLPMAGLWLLAPALLLGGLALAGAGAVLGLLMPKPELATVAGQLGMALVLFLGIIPAERLPLILRGVRALVPASYAVDAIGEGYRDAPRWGYVVLDLGVCAAIALAAIAIATWAFRRAVTRR